MTEVVGEGEDILTCNSWLDAAFSVNATHSSFFQMPPSVSITHKTFCEIHNSIVLPFLTLDKTSHRATGDFVTTILLP